MQESSEHWTRAFLQRLHGFTKLVGPTISCEGPAVQNVNRTAPLVDVPYVEFGLLATDVVSATAAAVVQPPPCLLQQKTFLPHCCQCENHHGSLLCMLHSSTTATACKLTTSCPCTLCDVVHCVLPACLCLHITHAEI